MPGTSTEAQVRPQMRSSIGIALTALATIVTLVEGEYPIALLFLCGTALFAAESVGRRLGHAAYIVDGAREIVRSPEVGPAGHASRTLHHESASNGSETPADCDGSTPW